MTDLHPERYTIHIIPDLDQHRFNGRVTMDLVADAAVETVTLDLFELAVWQCSLHQDDGWTPMPFRVNPGKETLTIQLPSPTTGPLRLRIDYEGIINDQMAGFYRSQTTHNGHVHRLAVTQFQESSARRAFPCMDHPLHKAVFELTVTAPESLAVLANTLPETQEPLEDGRKRITFAPTPRMSTYLLFFGLGPFQMTVNEADNRVRLAYLPGQENTTRLGLEFGRKALCYCEDYYDIAYPLPKMDLIAVPDFAFGAMENWGAITFRENLLLHYPDSTSKAGVQRICEVIAHEIAHQWFGNLVTPADWKYLWLNESFATYFGYGVVAHHHPQWEVWDQFLQNETATALARDGLQETFAIEMPGGKPMAINSSTAPIIYNKGGSILRMIEGYIGSQAYQEGVRGYLRTHQYQCAESHHLWQAFEAASSEPITAMMKTWIEQPGHPLVTATCKDNTLNLHQQRFTYLGKDNPQIWDIPITLTTWDDTGREEERTLLMQGETTTVTLPPGTVHYKLNNRQSGFYRVCYKDPDNLAGLGRLIKEKKMSGQDRWGIENDLYALVRQGCFPLADYLSYLDNYNAEDGFLSLASMAGHLLQATLVAPASQQGAIADKGLRLVDRVLERIGHLPAAQEPNTVSILRDQLLWLGALWGLDTAVAFGRDQFERLAAGEPIAPDIAKSTMQIAARTQPDTALPWFCQRFAESASEHERMNILTAFGSFPEWQITEKALAFTLEQVPARNRFIPIVAVATNPALQDCLWSWYQANLATLEKLHPLLYERVITSIFPYGGLGKEAEVNDFALGYIQANPKWGDAVRLALENLEINARMRNNKQ